MNKPETSLEKGVIKLKSFVCEPKTLPRDHNTFNLDDCEQAIIVALVDQKAKIREWLLINCKKDGFCILNKEGLKKFEELK